MRKLLLIPLLVLIVAGAAAAVCVATGHAALLPAMALAAGACTIASLIAVQPAILQRSADQAVVAQATLLGSLGHLLLSIVLGIGVCMANLVPQHAQLVMWMLVFYWVTLVAQSVVMTKILRQAPPVAKPSGALSAAASTGSQLQGPGGRAV